MRTDVDARRWSGGPRCKYCSDQLSHHEAVRGFCHADACESAYMRGLVEQASLRDRQKQEALLDELRPKAEAELARAAETLGVTEDELVIGVVPFQNRPLAPLSDDRLAEFRAELEKFVAEAFATAIDDSESGRARVEAERACHEPDGPAEFSAGCATCRGSCCNLGANTYAFLSADDVRRFRLRNPEAGPEDALAAYLDHLPEVSGVDSCVYHGPMGCTLPRAMRAYICNTYHCRGLKALEGRLGDRLRTGDAPVAIIAETMGRVNAVGAYDRAGGYRDVPLDAPELRAPASETRPAEPEPEL